MAKQGGGDDFGKGQQGVDDVLGNGIGRSGFGSENAHQRDSGQVPGPTWRISGCIGQV